MGKVICRATNSKIYLCGTETSEIDNKFAKVVAYLCGESCIESCKKVNVDFLKLTQSFMSSYATRTSEHFLKQEKPNGIKTKSPPEYR